MKSDIIREFYDKVGEIIASEEHALIEGALALFYDYVKKPEFMDTFTSVSVTNGYSRNRILCDEGNHVIYCLEWSPGFVLLPHEHHGKSTFEYVISGQMVISNWIARNSDHRFALELLETLVVNPGEHGIVDARVTDIHSVYTPVRTQSIAIFTKDYDVSDAYVLQDDDSYERKSISLKKW